jgi:hypothetical protein
MSNIVIKISPANLQVVKKHLKEGGKIKAIKHARTHGKEFPGREIEEVNDDGDVVTRTDHRVGLRNAKDAVEHLAGQNLSPQATFIGRLKIKSFIVEGDEGDVEMDLDGLQLRLLGELNTIPMRDVAEMLELVTFIRKWQGDLDEEPNV